MRALQHARRRKGAEAARNGGVGLAARGVPDGRVGTSVRVRSRRGEAFALLRCSLEHGLFITRRGDAQWSSCKGSGGGLERAGAARAGGRCWFRKLRRSAQRWKAKGRSDGAEECRSYTDFPYGIIPTAVRRALIRDFMSIPRVDLGPLEDVESPGNAFAK